MESDTVLGGNRSAVRESKAIALPTGSPEGGEFTGCHRGLKMECSCFMLLNIGDCTAVWEPPQPTPSSHHTEKIEMFPIEMLSVYSPYFLQAVYFIVILTLI